MSTPDLEGAASPADVEGGLWAPALRPLTVGLVLTVTLVAFESLAVATVMPEVKDDLGDLALYGWVFSGFFLGSLVGITVSGQVADRKGMAVPFSFGLLLFSLGLVIGGAAVSMPMLVVGRVAQGFGAGAIVPTAYTAIGRGMPARLRPRMFATLASAWVVPGLAGPAVAVAIAHASSWRWVFLGLLPMVALAGLASVGPLRELDRRVPVEPSPLDRGRLGRVVVLVIGVGVVLAASDVEELPGALAMVAIGLPVAVWAFRVLQPVGTLSLRSGVPATVAVRGLLTWAFFAGDAYVPLAITDGLGGSTWLAGLALSTGAVFWTGGAWIQARTIDDVGPRCLVGSGAALVAVGAVGMVATIHGLPVGSAVAAWATAAAGMGLAYAPLSVTVLAAATPGEEGEASAALHLSDTLGTAIGTGLGGAIVALGDGRGWSVAHSTHWVFVLVLTMAAVVVTGSRRLPRSVLSS
ncbi:MAG: MFS transporter [Acidimicrobiales bacterium]|nr:MFS transporter [Acidimicrobiales bacterium]